MKIFISYRLYENGAQSKARVRVFADRLRARLLPPHGLIFDQHEQENEKKFSGGGPNEGWARWSLRNADEADRILIIASDSWFRCYKGEEKADEGFGCAAEAWVVENRLWEEKFYNAFARIVCLDEPFDPNRIPRVLRQYHRFLDPDDFETIVSWITGEKADRSAMPLDRTNDERPHPKNPGEEGNRSPVPPNRPPHRDSQIWIATVLIVCAFLTAAALLGFGVVWNTNLTLIPCGTIIIICAITLAVVIALAPRKP